MTNSADPLAIEHETTAEAHAATSIPHFRASNAGASGPGLRSRLTARLRAGSLDRELMAGGDPSSSPQLAARAAQLTAPGTRAKLAEGLEHLSESAQGPQQRWSAVGRREALLGNLEEIGELAALLRSDTALYAGGIAILNEFLSDGTGCAYHGEFGEIADRLQTVRLAMQG
jgi:hypothetical protein